VAFAYEVAFCWVELNLEEDETRLRMSIKAIVFGGVVLIGGFASVLILLPSITPYEFLNCSPIVGGMQCSSSLNPVYTPAFIISMAGSVVLFFGVFGRRFVLGPLFVIGTLLMGLGSAGVTFGYLAEQWCTSQTMLPCVFVNPGSFTLAMLTGLILIGGNYWWWRGLPKKQVAIRP
jgi:hypothetical protein